MPRSFSEILDALAPPARDFGAVLDRLKPPDETGWEDVTPVLQRRRRRDGTYEHRPKPIPGALEAVEPEEKRGPGVLGNLGARALENAAGYVEAVPMAVAALASATRLDAGDPFDLRGLTSGTLPYGLREVPPRHLDDPVDPAHRGKYPERLAAAYERRRGPIRQRYEEAREATASGEYPVASAFLNTGLDLAADPGNILGVRVGRGLARGVRAAAPSPAGFADGAVRGAVAGAPPSSAAAAEQKLIDSFDAFLRSKGLEGDAYYGLPKARQMALDAEFELRGGAAHLSADAPSSSAPAAYDVARYQREPGTGQSHPARGLTSFALDERDLGHYRQDPWDDAPGGNIYGEGGPHLARESLAPERPLQLDGPEHTSAGHAALLRLDPELAARAMSPDRDVRRALLESRGVTGPDLEWASKDAFRTVDRLAAETARERGFDAIVYKPPGARGEFARIDLGRSQGQAARLETAGARTLRRARGEAGEDPIAPPRASGHAEEALPAALPEPANAEAGFVSGEGGNAFDVPTSQQHAVDVMRYIISNTPEQAGRAAASLAPGERMEIIEALRSRYGDEIPVYRAGDVTPGRPRSWTLDRRTAETFARLQGGGEVAAGVVRPEDVLFLGAKRDLELVLDPAVVRQAASIGGAAPSSAEASFVSTAPPPAAGGEAGFVSLGPLAKARDWVVENFKSGGPQAGRYALAAREFPPEAARVVRGIPGRIEAMEGRVAVARQRAQDLLDEAAPLVERIAPSRKGQKLLWEDLQAAAVGEKPLEEIPEALRPLVARRQELVEALQKRGLDTDAFPEAIAKAAAETGGRYWHRTYRAFKDPRWHEKVVDTPDWYAARDFLKKELPEVPDGEILDLLTALTKRRKGTHALAVQQAPARLNRMLRERQSIPEPLRRAMGEERDFRLTTVESVGELAHDIEAHNFWKELREDGLAAGVFRDPDVPTPPGYEGGLLRRIPGSNEVSGISSRGPVEGLLTRDALLDAIVGQFEVQRSTAWQRAAAMVNVGKTVGSFPMGHIRNFVAHHITSAVNGKNPGLVYTRARQLRRILADPAERATRDRMIELGILGEGASSQEIFDFLSLLEEGGPLGRAVARGSQGLAKSWRMGDHVWRAGHWLDEVEQLAWARPELSRIEVEALAAERVKDTFQTYSRAPEMARKLRRTPFGGPGVTFHMESVRNVKNIAKIAASDVASGIREGNPRMVVLGMRRAAGLMAGPVAVASLPAASRMLSGMDREQQEAARRQLEPYYHENAEQLFTHFDPGKEMSYIDISFLNPYSSLSRSTIAAHRAMQQGRPPVVALGEFLDQVSGGDIATKELLQLATNERMGSIWSLGAEKGPPITHYDEAPRPTRQLKDLGYHAYRGLAPGAVVQAENLARGAGVLPSETDTGRKFSLPQEIGATLGVRRTTQTIPRALKKNLSLLADRIGSLPRRVPPNPADLPVSAENYLTSWERLYNEVRATVTDFRTLGMTSQELRQAANQSRLPPAMVKAAFAGLPHPPAPVRFNDRGELPESWSSAERRPLALAIIRRWRERYLGKQVPEGVQ